MANVKIIKMRYLTVISMSAKGMFFRVFGHQMLCLLMVAALIGGCSYDNKINGVMYYQIPENESDSLKIFYHPDTEMIERLILTRTIDTEQMKQLSQTDDLDTAKMMLMDDYEKKRDLVTGWGEYASICTDCKLYGNEVERNLLTVRFSESINQVNDERHKSSKYFNYVEKYKFDFLVGGVDINNEMIREILQNYGLLDSYDVDTKAISYSLLKNDKNSMFNDFFEYGTLVQINEDGSVQKSK